MTRSKQVLRHDGAQFGCGIVVGLVVLSACNEIDPLCSYEAEVVESFPDLAELPTFEDLEEHPADIYERLLAIQSVAELDIVGAEESAVTLAFTRIGEGEVRRYTDSECPPDYRWVEVPTRVSLSDAMNEWSFVAEGRIRLNQYEELTDSFEVVSVDLGGALAEAAGSDASENPSEWFASTNHGFEERIFFALQLTYGDPNRPGGKRVLDMLADSE